MRDGRMAQYDCRGIQAGNPVLSAFEMTGEHLAGERAITRHWPPTALLTA